MSEQDGRPSGASRRQPEAPAPGAAPSPDAARRLADALSARTDAYRLRTSVELSLIDALVQMGAKDAASTALEDCSRVLEAYASDIEAAVASAAAEREAEQIVSTAVQADELLAARALIDTAPPDAAPPEETSRVGDPFDIPGDDLVEQPAGGARAAAATPGGAPLRSARRLIGSAVGVAAIALALVVPAWRAPAPTQQLTAAELSVQQDLMDARYRLAALSDQPAAPRTITSQARELHSQILALPERTLEHETVRHELRLLLDTERRALEDVADRAPEAHGLINEIHAIRSSLDLDAPGLPDREAPLELDVPLPVEPVEDLQMPPAEPPADDRAPVVPAPQPSGPPADDSGDAADAHDDEATGDFQDDPSLGGLRPGGSSGS